MAAGHGHHPNSLANLRPPWRPGQAGNPDGRKPGVVYVSEHVSSLLAESADGTPRYTKADLEKIVGDEKEAPGRVIAARWVLTCMADGRRWVVDRDGKLKPAALDPEPGRAIERLTDRLEGKPTQTLRVEQPTADPTELLAELREILAADPALLEEVRQTAELAALPVIDAEAAVIETTDGPE